MFLVAQAIDLIQAFAGGSAGEEQGSASEHADADALRLWMKRHRAAVLQDACTKQYDSAVEAARQFGHGELKEVFTAEERKRSRLDGGFEEDGRQRDDVEIVAAPEPAHVLRERDMAMAQARAMRHPYRAMPLTGAPPARFPLYLAPREFCRFPTLDENGHAPETLDPGDDEGTVTEGGAGYQTGWIDPSHRQTTLWQAFVNPTAIWRPRRNYGRTQGVGASTLLSMCGSATPTTMRTSASRHDSNR